MRACTQVPDYSVNTRMDPRSVALYATVFLTLKKKRMHDVIEHRRRL